MEDIPDLYHLETVEQIRAIADPLRLRILDALGQRALTATMLGEVLGLPANKVHYHVRELEKAGLVRLVETREKGGILEKYYRAVARSIDVPASLLRRLPSDESIAAVDEWLQRFSHDVVRAFSRSLQNHEQTGSVAVYETSLWLTRDEYRQLVRTIDALFEEYRDRRGIEGEREYIFAVLSYDAQLARDSAVSGDARPAVDPSRRSTTTAGTLHLTRRDLEETAARGEVLDINVAGLVAFDPDIPDALVDRVVGRFHHRGVLRASPEVRAVLQRKEG